MFNKFLIVLVVALVMFSCGTEARKLRTEHRSNMEDEMAKWDVSGTQGLGDSCSFWSAKWCQVGLRCSSGTCVKD